MSAHSLSRRQFLITSALAAAGSSFSLRADPASKAEPIIDIHQHTSYRQRSTAELIAHQRAMGVTQTILL
ncbi:MAG: amidohydrolase family protein, partial [Limisphaerales bacterium]